MGKSPLNPKYTRVEIRIDLIIREVIQTGQILETGGNLQIIGPGRTVEIAFLRKY